jgi:hypothetical protein
VAITGLLQHLSQYDMEVLHVNRLAIELESIHYVSMVTPSRVQWLLLNSGCPASTVIFGITGVSLVFTCVVSFPMVLIC